MSSLSLECDASNKGATRSFEDKGAIAVAANRVRLREYKATR